MRGFAVVMLVGLGACSFKPGALPADGGPDGPPPITIGFAKTTTQADEASGVVPIRVVLSAPSDEAVTVAYAITGGTATEASDYTGTGGTLTFAPGDVEEVIDLTVIPDGVEESDETVDLELSSVTGNGVALASALHTMTIAANVLPRVSFTTTTSMGAENTSPTITVMLDTAPAVPTTVNVVASGTSTATGGGVDYTLTTTTVSFAIGETSKPVTLTVNNDTLDEVDEDAIITLDSPTNTILATTNTTYTHQIQDNDLPPTVSFAAGPTSSVSEAGTMVDLTVSLSTASGKNITVPFAVDGTSSATATADYTIGTTSPLSFPAGMTSKTIRVNLAQDTSVEVGETVVLTLGALDTTIVTAGTDTTHTLTITDDDGTCVGRGTYVACFATIAGATTINTSINTDTDGRCVSPAAGWTGQPASCFITGATVSVTGSITVTGGKPLVLLATGNLSISASVTIDASSHRGGTNGPGANSALCTAYSDAPNNGNTGAQTGAGGGAGASFRSAGGNGGNGGVGNTSGGGAVAAVGAPSVLRGGCAGQTGGSYNGGGSGPGGAGGGAVYLVSGATLSMGSAATVNVSGAGGSSPGARGGGGGGGSGGMLKLIATTFSVSGARLLANGGGGSGGGDDNTGGTVGNDPSAATPTTPAAGGANGSAGADGGDGFAGTTQATGGSSAGGDLSFGGGGGGGGGGHIEANAALTGATVSTGP